MIRRSTTGLMKHADFILIDLICMQVSFVIAYWLFHGFLNPYANEAFQFQAAVLAAAQLVVIVFIGNYSGILKRGRIDEAIAVIKYMISVFLIALVYLFVVHETGIVSRLQYGFTAVLFVLLSWTFRFLNKNRVNAQIVKKTRHIVLITIKKMLPQAMEKISSDKACSVQRIFLLDRKKDISEYEGIPVHSLNGKNTKDLVQNWVDEAVVVPPENGETYKELTDLTEQLINAGIVVSYVVDVPDSGNWTAAQVNSLGNYKVFTTSLRSVSMWELALKRAIDIIGSLVGCLITGILYIFVAPLIRFKSPGSVFFTQERIGQNGKPFTMHKFRTMYPDAEDRKPSLMSQNKVKSNMMFKMDDDPRIIGSEKKDRHGKACGIGNILRAYSLDEFPQFLDVLRGDMSLVGWRPCTMEEWENYNMEHRIRASMKPGITGIWQVSGRSNLTDFNEVVKMDREYIENWSIGLDLRILIKTVWVVMTRKGAA